MKSPVYSGGCGEDSIHYFTMEEMIKEAKAAVVKACPDGHKRKWLGSVELCPYTMKGGGSESCQIRFWALEGTPIRGFVIANYGLQAVVAFDGHFKRLKIKRGGKNGV